MAKKFKLPVAEKKDSQGICFLGPVDLKEFLKHYIKPKKGKLINEKGENIGYHAGAVFLTLGERHGFTVTKKSPNDKPYYILSKDVKKNILVVSQNKNSKNFTIPTNYIIEKANWISGIPDPNKTYTAQVRYHGELLPCKIKISGKAKAKAIFEKPVLAAAGQSCVFYDRDVCLGGGVII